MKTLLGINSASIILNGDILFLAFHIGQTKRPLALKALLITEVMPKTQFPIAANAQSKNTNNFK